MFCYSVRRLVSLPFESMALTTLDVLEGRLAALKEGSNSENGTAAMVPRGSRRNDVAAQLPGRAEALEWFSNGNPFFISPKHDGVRLVSYQLLNTTFVPNTSRTLARQAKQTLQQLGPAPMTCFSRYGRPIHGLFWIEQELRLLRALCGDDSLVLDGELYIHRFASSLADSDASSLLHAGRSAKKNISSGTQRKPHRATHSRLANKAARCRRSSKANQEPANQSSAIDEFKTGFLAVSSLVHRLRGSSSSQLTTEEDVLQFVSSLPRFCVFDTPSYNPSAVAPGTSAALTSSARRRQRAAAVRGTPPEVEAERIKVWEDTLSVAGVRDVEELRCTPNITPFSQRIRTLHVLCSALEKASQSSILRAHYLHESSSCRRRGEKSGLKGSYRGGAYVQMIPYTLSRSLVDAGKKLLPAYVSAGYEGAVIRTPMNVYEMREKRKGTVRKLVAGLSAQEPSSRSGSNVLKESAARILRSYTRNAAGRGLAMATHTLEGDVDEGCGTDRGSAQQQEDNDSAEVAQLAIRRCATLSRRSETVVKLLPFKDAEYAVLRPLFKTPSTNPRTRTLVTVPTKRTDSSAADGRSRGKLKGCEAGGVVAFYGLQCLAENGRAFNVSLPKMSREKQKALLAHLMSAGKKRRGSGKSLTGLYVTVKYPTLTEHGVPRFGTVKAIRGGKGWFL